MSDYVKTTDFAAKDSLPSGNALKTVRGTEIDAEFNAIEAAVQTKADSSSPLFTGEPKGPNPVVGVAPTNHLATVNTVTSEVAKAFPVGGIIMWGGSYGTWPSGWRLCDGGTHTRSDGLGSITVPDLRDRFIVAAGASRSHLTVGGSDTHNHTADASGTHSHGGVTGGTALTQAQMPAHTHDVNMPANLNSTNIAPVGATNGTIAGSVAFTTTAAGSGQVHDHSIGADGSHTHTVQSNLNVPAYYALAFICKI
jgi:microcystin-dependent protein